MGKDLEPFIKASVESVYAPRNNHTFAQVSHKIMAPWESSPLKAVAVRSAVFLVLSLVASAAVGLLSMVMVLPFIPVLVVLYTLAGARAFLPLAGVCRVPKFRKDGLVKLETLSREARQGGDLATLSQVKTLTYQFNCITQAASELVKVEQLLRVKHSSAFVYVEELFLPRHERVAPLGMFDLGSPSAHWVDPEARAAISVSLRELQAGYTQVFSAHAAWEREVDLLIAAARERNRLTPPCLRVVDECNVSWVNVDRALERLPSPAEVDRQILEAQSHLDATVQVVDTIVSSESS